MAGINEDTKLMLHCNGADESTVFTDESPSAHGNANVVADVEVDTAEQQWGTGSALFDGDSGYLWYADHDDWDICELSTDDWTIDFWVKFNDYSGIQNFIMQRLSSDSFWQLIHYSAGIGFALKAGGEVVIDTGYAGAISDTTNWHHIALIKVGDKYAIYKDGTQVNYVQDSSTTTFAANLYIGYHPTVGRYFNGHMDEIRIQHSNYFEAAPNDTPDDEIDEPTGEYTEGISKNIITNLKGTESVAKDILSDLKDTISVAKNIVISLCYGCGIAFNLKGAVNVAKNILANLKKAISTGKDISFYLSEATDIKSNLKTTLNVSKNIAFYIELVTDVAKNVIVNLKKAISTAYDVGAVLANEDIYDFDSDIRWKLEQNKNIGFALTLPSAEVLPAGLDEVKVYVGGNLLTDVDIRTAEWTWTMNDRPGSCSFLVARKFDKFNHKLTGDASSLAVNQVIEIKFNGTLKFYGYIVNLDVSADRETVIVRGLDRKYKIAKELCSKDYGRHSESGYDRTGAMLNYILGDLVTKGYISSYSGVPSGIVPELREQDGMSYGILITELLEQSGNYKWNVTPNGVLKIYVQGSGILKEISYQESNRQIGLYDIIDCRFTINDISNMITTAEVVMGTESVETYSSYNRVFLKEASLFKAWNSNQESLAKSEFILNQNMLLRGMLIGDPNRVKELLMDVWRRYSIPEWAEGSFIDTTVKPYVTRDYYSMTTSGLYTRVYTHAYSGSWNSYGADWRIEDGYVYFSNPQIICTRITYNLLNDSVDDEQVISAFNPRLTMAFYKKETLELAIHPTIFDVVFVGSGGAGYKRRLVFANLGVASAVYWNEYLDGELVWHYKPAYNDTIYATDRARLFLSRVNDPITQGSFSMTLDAQDYFGLDLNKRVNIINTEKANIYRDDNNFPIDVEEIKFDAGTYMCTISGRNRRAYICSQDIPEREE